MGFSEINFASTAAESRAAYVGKKPGSREDVRENAGEVGNSATGAMGAGARCLEGNPAKPFVVSDIPAAVQLPGEVVEGMSTPPARSTVDTQGV
ncbi:MAG: hypothetical protein ABIH56_06700 [Candidatus Margulisiibacteriota bacterium]